MEITKVSDVLNSFSVESTPSLVVMWFSVDSIPDRIAWWEAIEKVIGNTYNYHREDSKEIQVVDEYLK
jgi:hypothetical protein